MGTSMAIEVVPLKWFGVLVGVVVVVLFGAFLTGLLGPGTHSSQYTTAFTCADGGNTWGPLCSGVQLGLPATSFNYTLSPLSKMNGFWSMVVYPYVSTNAEFIIQAQVSVEASKDGASWKTLVNEAVRDEVVVCSSRQPPPVECWGFVMLYEDAVQYPYYRIQFSFPDTADNENKNLIGNVMFEFVSYSTSYTTEQLVMRSLFLVLSLVLLVVMGARLCMFPLRDWTMEQRCLMVMLLGVIVLNNPLYSVQYAVAGWFFPLFDELCHLFHSVTVLLFWLFVFDYYRRGELKVQVYKWDAVKPVVVGLWAAFSASFFLWFRVAREVNPVLGNADHISGDVVVFFFCALLLGAILVWVLVVMMLAMPVIWNKRHFAARYIFTAVVTALVLLSILGALFFGSYGPMRVTSLPFVYFYTLFNLVPWVLAVGYWPLRSSFSDKVSNPIVSEDTPIFGAAGSTISSSNL